MRLTRGQKRFLADIALANETGRGRPMMGVMASTDSRRRWLRQFIADGLVRLEADTQVADQTSGATASVAWLTDAGRAAVS